MNIYGLGICLKVFTYIIKGGVLAQYGIVEIECVGSLRNYSLNYLIFVGSKLALYLIVSRVISYLHSELIF
jgi:hypothetical protein